MVDRPKKTRSGGPNATRLQAAIDLVVARLKPDQIILFGSAARHEMTESSDLDLLVIKSRGPHEPQEEHECWRCQETGDDLDVVLVDPATAERRRRSAAYIPGAALEEGRTIYAREGVTPLRTGPIHTWDGMKMVKSTLYEPDYASTWLAQAERKWRSANREEHPVDKCENLQASMERALKALIVSQGRRVKHKHDLESLWKEAEANGERIAATPDPEELAKLTRYAGEWQYPVDGIDPETTWSLMEPAGRDVLNHARKRVPELMKETGERLRKSTRETDRPGSPRRP